MAKNGPRDRKPRLPGGIQELLEIPHFQLSFDAEAFDNLVKGQGVFMQHFKGMPDPTGKLARADVHAVAGPNGATSDSFLFFDGGTFQGYFSSNSLDPKFQLEGQISSSVAYVTVPTKYCDKDDDVLISVLDRLYLKDVETRVVATQWIESNMIGVDKLQFPATCIERIVDTNGQIYTEGTHFELTDQGNIKWISQSRPGWNQEANKGVVYSIRYRYTPFFVVGRIMHEVRVYLVTDPMTGDRKVIRAPYQVMIVRENVFRDVNNAEKVLNELKDERFQKLPPVGGNLGPRNP